MRIVCPRCQRIHSVMDNIHDFICDCNDIGVENTTLAQEDIFKLGTYNDYSGSGGDTNLLQGAENTLQGTRAEIEGVKTHKLTPIGNIASLYRQRGHLEYINLENGKDC